MEQLEDNLKSVDVNFTPDELEKLDAVSKLPVEYPDGCLSSRGMTDSSSGPRSVRCPIIPNLKPDKKNRPLAQALE